MIWECAERSWDEVWRSDKSWDQLRRCEKSLEDVRRGKRIWEDVRWADMSCGELKRALKIWEKLRWKEMRKAQMTWEEKRTVVISWEELRMGEKTWDGMRWDAVEKAEKTWGESRWDGMTQTAVTVDAVSNFQGKLRCDEIRWNEKSFNIQKTWHQIERRESRACCCEAQESCLSPIGTAFAPLYRLYCKRFKFETSVPGLPRYYLYRNPSLVLQLNITPCVGSITIQQTKKPYDSPTADNSKYPLQKYSCNIWEL